MQDQIIVVYEHKSTETEVNFSLDHDVERAPPVFIVYE